MSDGLEEFRQRLRDAIKRKRDMKSFNPQVVLQRLLQKNLESFEGAPPLEERRLPPKTPRLPLTKVLPSKIPRLPLEGKKQWWEWQ